MKSFSAALVLCAVPACAFVANGPKTALVSKKAPLSTTFSYLASLGVSDGGGSPSTSDVVSPYFAKSNGPNGLMVNDMKTETSSASKDAYTVSFVLLLLR